VPELKKVIVGAGVGGDSTVVMKDTLAEALQELFKITGVKTLEGLPDNPGGASPPQSTTTTTAPPSTGGSTSSTSSTSTTPGTQPSTDIPTLINQANDDLTQAEAARKSGDLATYQQKVTEAAAKLQAIVDLQNQTGATTTTAAPAGPSA
jgi:uncharacterized membrane protein (UPF0182 family)